MRGLRPAQLLARQGPSSLGSSSLLSTSSRWYATATAAATSSSLPGLPSLTSSRPASSPLVVQHLLLPGRSFSHTAPQRKKAKHSSKAAGAAPAATNQPSDSGPADGRNIPEADPSDPFNFSDAEAKWGRAETYYTGKLKLFRAGGRFNPDVIGGIPVQQTAAEGAAAARLSDLAVVVPTGGRTVEIRMHQAGYRKAIMSAVQASPDFNQQPQPDPDNDLVLYLKVEPEDAAEQARRAKEMLHAWRERVRVASHVRTKKHQDWKKDKAVGVDDLRRLDKELARKQDAVMAKIDAAEKDILKHLSSRQGKY